MNSQTKIQEIQQTSQTNSQTSFQPNKPEPHTLNNPEDPQTNPGQSSNEHSKVFSQNRKSIDLLEEDQAFNKKATQGKQVGSININSLTSLQDRSMGQLPQVELPDSSELNSEFLIKNLATQKETTMTQINEEKNEDDAPNSINIIGPDNQYHIDQGANQEQIEEEDVEQSSKQLTDLNQDEKQSIQEAQSRGEQEENAIEQSQDGLNENKLQQSLDKFNGDNKYLTQGGSETLTQKSLDSTLNRNNKSEKLEEGQESAEAVDDSQKNSQNQGQLEQTYNHMPRAVRVESTDSGPGGANNQNSSPQDRKESQETKIQVSAGSNEGE